MKTYRRIFGDSDKSGVAIVIVLGLIAVLMLMAVAFSIHMRIERTGAANYRYGVQARHMVYAGLANAINDIEGLMQSSIYPEWDIACSTGGVGRAAVLTHRTAASMPVSLANKARRLNVTWQTIKDNGGTGTERGRYAFIILNSSGLLDANRVGRQTRRYGTNTTEIMLDGILGEADAAQFEVLANAHKRYETFAELTEINSTVPLDENLFSLFSLARISRYYDIGGENGDRVSLGDLGPNPDVWSATKIKQALTLSGVTQIDRVYRNMQDWVDDDCIPRALDECCGEAVPMFNEASLTNDITATSAGTFEWRWEPAIELFYPFKEKSPDSFEVEIELEWTARAGMSHPEMLPPNQTINTTVNTPTRRWYQIKPRQPPHTGALSSTNAVNVDAILSIKGRVKKGGTVVDEVPSPYDGSSPMSFRVFGAIPRDGVKKSSLLWAECVDPRFNWSRGSAEGASGNMWEESSRGELTEPSIGDENQLTIKVLAGGDSRRLGNYDGDTHAHVGDRPFTRVGDLGCIAMAPWTSLRLYDHGFATMRNSEQPYHKVLDYFVASTNEWQRGVVNINTTNTDVLAALFYDCPIDEDDAAGKAFSNEVALAEDIIAAGPYTNISNIGEAGVADWAAHTAGVSDFERESLIRNSADLLTARDNLFTVIIRADSFSVGMGGDPSKGMSLATSRAVAEIWRDPIPDENGNHKFLVRSFAFVDD